MDQNQNSTQDEHPLRVPYGYNDSPHDSFNSFLNNDSESTFNQPWNSQSFNPHSEPSNSYDQAGQGWPHNPLSAPNIQHVPSYGIHSGIYDQSYSRSPASFDYSGFNQNRNPALSAPSYDHNFNYGQPPAQNHDHYGFPRGNAFQHNLQQTQNQTISPQALQNPPSGYQQNQVQRVPFVSITQFQMNIAANNE